MFIFVLCRDPDIPTAILSLSSKTIVVSKQHIKVVRFSHDLCYDLNFRISKAKNEFVLPGAKSLLKSLEVYKLYFYFYFLYIFNRRLI